MLELVVESVWYRVVLVQLLDLLVQELEEVVVLVVRKVLILPPFILRVGHVVELFQTGLYLELGNVLALLLHELHDVDSFVDLVLDGLVDVPLPVLELLYHPPHWHIENLLLVCLLTLEGILSSVQQELVLLVADVPYCGSVVLKLSGFAHLLALSPGPHVHLADFLVVCYQATLLPSLLGVASFSERGL